MPTAKTAWQSFVIYLQLFLLIYLRGLHNMWLLSSERDAKLVHTEKSWHENYAADNGFTSFKMYSKCRQKCGHGSAQMSLDHRASPLINQEEFHDVNRKNPRQTNQLCIYIHLTRSLKCIGHWKLIRIVKSNLRKNVLLKLNLDRNIRFKMTSACTYRQLFNKTDS